jgi:hypothetical protein
LSRRPDAPTRQEFAAALDRIVALERTIAQHRGRRRDDRDAALLVAVAGAVGAMDFTAADVIALAPADPTVRQALEAAHVTTARRLGKRFARVEGHALAGFCLTRLDTERHVITWRIWAAG